MHDLGKKSEYGVGIGAEMLKSEEKVHYPTLYVDLGEGGKLPKLDKEGYAKVKYKVCSMTVGTKRNSMELEIMGIEQCDKVESGRPMDISDAFDKLASEK